jgi:Spy/CpxP family protein refolding chaperone
MVLTTRPQSKVTNKGFVTPAEAGDRKDIKNPGSGFRRDDEHRLLCTHRHGAVLGLVFGGFLMALWLVPAPVLGQEIGQGRWWRWPRLAERLQLTEGQRTQLDEKFYASRRHLIDLRAQVEREQLEVQRLLEREPLDDTAVLAQFKNLDAARAKLARERFAFIVEIRKIVGLDRFKQLTALAQEFKRRIKNKAMDRIGKGRFQQDEDSVMETGMGEKR